MKFAAPPVSRTRRLEFRPRGAVTANVGAGDKAHAADAIVGVHKVDKLEQSRADGAVHFDAEQAALVDAAAQHSVKPD